MSEIEQIIDRCEWRAERGNAGTPYSDHLNMLQAMNVIANELERIADALELRNLHDGITRRD